MSDFYQGGVITTLHRLGPRLKLEDAESKLRAYTAHRPVALVLPCLFSELQTPALRNIVRQLQRVRYVRQVVIGIDRADRRQFQRARRYFSVLPQDVRLLWRDGPRLQRLNWLMNDHDLSVGGPGKGSNIWLSTGFVLA